MLQAVKRSVRVGEKEIIIETGRIARQADGSCLIRQGDTLLLVTAMADRTTRDVDFLPLTVDYREKTYAAGKIPGGFFKREGRPTEVEIINSRIIDRSIRPILPKGWNFETQVIALPLSADPFNPPDVLAATGASLALGLSDIPFGGPLATVRVGRVEGKLLVNPTFTEMEKSDFDLVVTSSEKAIVMVEGEANQVPEADLVEALFFAFEQAQPLIEVQKALVAERGKAKRSFEPHKIDEQLAQAVREAAEKPLIEALQRKEKLPRNQALRALRLELIEQLKEKFPQQTRLELDVEEVLEEMKKKIVRRWVAEEGRRLDGRNTRQVREINIEVGLLPRAHGSALFTRGETQAVVTTTLGTSRDEQLVENLEGDFWRKFMVHYNFPPFATAEVKPLRGPGRREIGHGRLAERALSKVLPPYEDFSYTIRVVSEITESNGSSSMATVCGGSLSLMDAGVKTLAPVAGVAMGLMKEGQSFHVLTDILGDEDHLGDMDFKVAGTEKGVTAIQMDIKIDGISREIFNQALEQAREARLHVLGEMNKVLAAPRPDISPYAPRITVIQIKPDRIKDVIGPQGRVIKDITAQTGCTIDIEDDGTVRIGSTDPAATEKALKMIRELTQEAEVGKIYMGVVRKLTEFGAFCEILPGTDGLLHISEISEKRVEKITDVLHEGDEVLVKVIGIDRQGKIRLSRKEALNQKANGGGEN